MTQTNGTTYFLPEPGMPECLHHSGHDFERQGVKGVEIQGEPDKLQAVNRYHCKRCLLTVEVEDIIITEPSDHRVQEALASFNGRKQ